MDCKLSLEGVVRALSLEKRGAGYVLREGEECWEVEIRPVSENELRIVRNGRAESVFTARDGTRTLVWAGGREFVFTEPRRGAGRGRGGAGAGADGTVQAPMPGKVIKLCVAAGDAVAENQPLLIVEAMKMENVVLSGLDGVVKTIHVAVGDLVDAEKTLLEIEPKGS